MPSKLLHLRRRAVVGLGRQSKPTFFHLFCALRARNLSFSLVFPNSLLGRSGLVLYNVE